MKKVVIYFTTLVTILVLSNCTGCDEQKKKVEVKKVDFESLTVLNSGDAVFYAIPSPEEIMSYINSNNVKFKDGLVYDNKLAKELKQKRSKTITLGIYLADAAYLSFFDKTDNLADYVIAINYLMEELNINPAISESQQKVILNSGLNSETIFELSKELYDSVVNYLQDADDGRTLAIIMSGTICESLYITTKLNSDYNHNKASVKKIAEQKLLFEDVIAMLEPYKNDDLRVLYNGMMEIKGLFDKMDVKSNISKVEKTEDGTIHISGENTIEIGEMEYLYFSKKIESIRKNLLEL